MLPQLHLSSGNEPSRSARVVRGSAASHKIGACTTTTTIANGSFSGSDTGSVGQTSSTSGKFEEAMEVYHQSMAIRRRKMSASGNAAMRSMESYGGDSAELNTVVQNSSSLRGPQLKPSTHLTRVDGSHLRSPIVMQPQQQTPQQQKQVRAACRLPSLVSQINTAAAASPSISATQPTAQQHQQQSSLITGALGNATSVLRRSTRRPLSCQRPHTPRGSTSASSNTSSAAESWRNVDGSNRAVNSSTFSHSGDHDSRRRSIFLSGEAPIRVDDDDMRGLAHNDSVLGSMDQIVLHSPAAAARANTSTTGATYQSGQSSRVSSAHRDTQAPPRDVSSFTGVRSEASQDPSSGSYDVLGLDAVLMAASQDDLTVQRRSSLYQPTLPESTSSQRRLPPPPPAAAAAAGAAVAATFHASRPASAAAGVSSSCELSTPTKSPSGDVKPTATDAAVRVLPPSATPSVSSSLSGASFGLPALRTPRPDRIATTWSPSQSHALPPSKSDNAGRSASQAGLSSATNISVSHTVSGAAAAAAAETSRRDLVAPASPNSLAAAAATTTRNPIDMLPQPGVVQPSDKQTAQFYSTASLAKTYDGSQFLNDYILLSEIGSGATGRVVLAFSTSMMCSVAIKIIVKPRERKYRLQRVCDSSDSSPAVSNLSEKRGDRAGPDNSDSNNNNNTSSGGGRSVHSPTSASTKDRGSETPTTSGTASAAAQPATSAGVGANGARNSAASPTAAGGNAGAPRTRVPPQARLTTAERITRNLQREIDVMKDLHHPNIVRLYEVINDPKANSLFLILQYVDSGAVAQLNSAGHIAAPFLPDDLLPIATQVIDGLVYLHEHRIIHRDIKPENILVNRDGQAFLADFGVAELMNAEAGLPTTATLAYQGTPLFMAPEIYAVDDDDDDNEDVDVRNVATEGDPRTSNNDGDASAPSSHSTRRSTAATSNSGSGARQPRTIDPYALDVWALGVTFFTLLVGHVPFQSMLQIRETVKKGVDIPSSVPAAWREVLQRTMAPDVDQRISSAGLKQLLHTMHDAHDHTDTKKDLQQQKRKSHGGRGRARGTAAGRTTAAAAARSAWAHAEDEDVILGSGTPDEMPLHGCSNGRLGGDVDGDSDDVECSFSINSSVMDVLRPSRR